MTDTVYVCRDGENPELRYSLRSLVENVVTDNVFIVGSAPEWVDTDLVTVMRRSQMGSAYRSVRAHIKAACDNPDVSDPFVLWNDDFYAMDFVGVVGPMHRGSLEKMGERFATTKTPWARGLHETVSIVKGLGIKDPLSYDAHVPLVVLKDDMRRAIRLVEKIAKTEAVHLRTIYGNMADLGGYEIEDPKMMRKSDPFPRRSWLSSGDDTFRSTVEPVLRYVFPYPITYERF